MTTTCLPPCRSSMPKTPKRLAAKPGKPLVSEEHVKALLREIAFVLHCTRRISAEIKAPARGEE